MSGASRLRAAGGALVLAGAVWLLAGPTTARGDSSASVEATVTVAPAVARQGTFLDVAGSGFLPQAPVAFTFCPARGCAGLPRGGAADCQPPDVSAQGSFACRLAVPLYAAGGDWTVTATQAYPYNDLAAGSLSCPSPLASLPGLPAGAPSGDPSPCRRQASAIVTVVPGVDTTPAPSPPATPAAPPSQPPVPAVAPLVAPPSAAPTATSAATAAAAPATIPRPPASPHAIVARLPWRNWIPGVLAVVAGLFLGAMSLAPAPTEAGGGSPNGRAATGGGESSRLAAFVARHPRTTGTSSATNRGELAALYGPLLDRLVTVRARRAARARKAPPR